MFSSAALTLFDAVKANPPSTKLSDKTIDNNFLMTHPPEISKSTNPPLDLLKTVFLPHTFLIFTI